MPIDVYGDDFVPGVLLVALAERLEKVIAAKCPAQEQPR